jgi:hypothetical protein
LTLGRLTKELVSSNQPARQNGLRADYQLKKQGKDDIL